MKATTTVTTSSYYGKTQNVKINPEILQGFISPQQMLRRLIPYGNAQKQKQNIQPVQRQTFNNESVSRNVLIADIQNLQSDLNNIHAQIVQSENLHHVRDSLYDQLDMLRQQRQNIENDVEYFQSNSQKQVRVNVRQNRGYKEMNQRLRRRMHEIREYVHKMELQNRKIEDNMSYNSILTIQKNYRTQANSASWTDNAYVNQREKNFGKVDDLITRLHQKQQEALQRVRIQEEQIDRRNNFNRASFANTSGNLISNQMGARSYHSPSPGASYGGRKFYSPSYRY